MQRTNRKMLWCVARTLRFLHGLSALSQIVITALRKLVFDGVRLGWIPLLLSSAGAAQVTSSSSEYLPETIVQQNGVLVTTGGGVVDEDEWLPTYRATLHQPSRHAAFSDGNVLLFGGVHGFRGPTDLGQSGNFGFHEGLNWSAPLGDPWGFSYQIGFQAVHSNFAGSLLMPGGQASPLEPGARNQIFVTGALFRRAYGRGIQSGVAFDYFHDSHYENADLMQLRSETAFVLSDLREIGYWGAYGLSRDTVASIGQFDGRLLDPTDLFAFFYRRHFSGGGQGRIWAGLSGDGDAVFGLDGTVPLGTSWALDNNFTYLIPQQGRGTDGQREESWSVSIHLVWYPGREARSVFADPHHPLFYVADNSWFLVDRRQ